MMLRRWSKRWRSDALLRLRPRLHRRVAEAERLALLEPGDLLEALAEIKLEVVPLRPAEMRRAQHVVHLQERMTAAGDRLLLIDVDRGIARPALLQRLQERARLDQLGARHIDEQRR